MFKYIAGGIAGLVLVAAVGNQVWNIPTGIDLNNNYTSRIKFGATAASVEQALPEFIAVENWLQSRSLTTGYTCVWFWEQSQRCELSNLSAKVSDTVKTLKSANTEKSTVADKALVLQQVRYGWFLHEGEKSGEQVYMPKDFQNYLKFGANGKQFGALLDFFALLALIVLVLCVSLIPSK